MKNNINFYEKKIIVLVLILSVIILIYILYLNFSIINLKNNLRTQENIYKIQINNRIDEISQLNQQLTDLYGLLDIGLDISKKDNIYLNTKLEEKEKNILLSNIPSGLPLKQLLISSRYGERIHPISNLEAFHTGIDLKIKKGENVYSTADGVVFKIRNEDTGGYGKFIIILHNYGFSSLYGHLDDILVKEGQFISKNSVIGISGNTGNSTGPHLHYEVKFLEKHINPINFLYWNKKTFDSVFKNNNIDWENLMYLIKFKEKNNYE